jgi:hypothetical protein
MISFAGTAASTAPVDVKPVAASPLDRPARFTAEDVSLPDGLERLHASSGVPLAYSPDMLPPGHLVSCDCADMTVGRALSTMLDGLQLVSTVLDGGVVLIAPPKSAARKATEPLLAVELDGEAFFAVAKDSSRPFAVRTRAGSVEVLGTRFDLRVEGDELRLVVTEGKVALTSGNHRLLVVAGQVAHVRNGGQAVVENAVKVDSLLSWTDGFIVFQNTPLRQVARELERRYDVRVLLPDSTIASRTVTAWFTNQDFRQVLFAICRAVDAHCTLRDSVASIEP